MTFASLPFRRFVPTSLSAQPASRGLWLKLVVLALAVLAGGLRAHAQADQCSAVAGMSGGGAPSGLIYALSTGEVVSGTITGPGTIEIDDANRLQRVLLATTTGPFSYTIPSPSGYGISYSTANFTIQCAAPQTTWTVTTASDDATGVAANCATGSTTACSLRDALAAASASTSTGLVVNFSPTAFPATNTAAQNTITLGRGGTLTVTNNTTIQGLTTGSGASLQNLVTVSGDNTTNIFSVQSGTAAINNLTMTAGYAQGAAFGGAIFINSGTLTLNQDTVSNNQATLGGGGIFNAGTLTITNSTISGNKTGSSGSGGGIYQSGGTLTISNSTIANNVTAGGGGGMYLGSGSASLTSATVTGNSALSGGGVYASGSVGTLSYSNSILAGNSASTAYPDTTGNYTTNGVNVLHYLSSGSSYYTAFTLALAPLGSYGGPTQTMPARPTSPASCASTTGSGTDQRGVARPTVYTGSNCNDVGATNSLYSLVWTTEPATSYSVGQALSPAPVLQLEDDGAAFSGIGSLSLTDSTGTYSDSFETFSTSGSYSAGLTYPSTEQSVTLTASASFSSYSGANSGTISSAATTPAFNVVNPVTGFRISTLNNVMAGTAQSVTVTALNGSGTSTSYTGTVAFSSTDSVAGLPSSYTFTTSDAGVHTFTNGVTFKTSGTGQTITVTDASASVTKTSNAVTVTPAAAATVAATGTTTISLATGASFGSTALQVQVLDAFANGVGGATVTYSVPPSGASAALGAATCTTNASGMCSVTATANSLPGPYTIAASVGGVATPVTFNVTNTGTATYTVTVATDTTTGVAANCTENGTTDASCSLRDALAAAATLPASGTVPVTVQFSATAFASAITITEANGTLNVPSYTTVQGATSGSGVTLQNLVTVSGNNANSVFTVASGVTGAVINNLTITQGAGTMVNGGLSGGGIDNAGSLTVNSSTFTANTLPAVGTFGGAILNGSSALGSNAALTVNACTFTGNSAASGGAIYSASSGGITVSNSTFTGNTAYNGGAIEDVTIGPSSFTNITVTGNTATQVGAIYIAVSSSSEPTISNSIISGNTATSRYPDLLSSAYAGSGNVVGPTTRTAGTSAAPGVSALGFYGGPTQTMPALPGGAATCAGSVSNVGNLTTDQRGKPRVASYGATTCVDAGATQSAYSLAFVQQPTTTAAGSSITPAPTVQLYDNGVAVPLAGATLNINATNGTLSGTTQEATNASGLATFSGLSIGTAETGDTLNASASLIPSYMLLTTSSAFNIITVNHFAFTLIPTTATAGSAFAVTVTAYTSTDNSQIATGYTGPVTFTSSDPQAVLPTGTVTLNAGTNTFSITLKTAGGQTLTVADSSGSPSLTSGTISVSATVAARLGTVSSSAATQSAVIGAAFGTPLGVKVTDFFGNPVGGTLVTFTAPTGGASAVLSAPTCTTSTTAGSTLGTCSVTATANGTASSSAYNVEAVAAGQGAGFTLTNLKASPSLTVTASPAALVYGQPVTITATSVPANVGGSSPTGAVTFYDNTTTLTPASTPVSGISTYATTALVGSQTYAASTAADTNFNAVAKTSASTIVVAKASSTLTGPTTQPVQVTASTTGSIPVSVTGQYSGSAVSTPSGSIGYTIGSPCSASCTGTATITAGAASIPVASTLAVGTYIVAVTYAGDTNYSAATGINVSLLVGQLTPTVTFSPTPPASIVYGTTLSAMLDASATYNSAAVPGGGTMAYTATPAGGSPSAVVGTTVLDAGTYTITATFTPTNTVVYKTVSASITLTVNQASQTITFAPPATPVTFGVSPIALSATGGASGNAVVFSIVSGPGTISGSTLTVTGAGTIVIAANQAASTNYSAAAQVTQSVVVNQASQTITFAPASPVTFGVAPIMLTATGGASGNPVTYTLVSGPATLNGSVLTVTGAGLIVLSANQAGNANYTAASTASATIVVNKATPSVALVSSLSPVLVQNAVTFTATLSSSAGLPANGDTVTFLDNTTPLGTGTVTAGVATFTTTSLAIGTHPITAVFGGDANFTTQTSPMVSQVVDDFSLSISTSAGSVTSATILPGATATYLFTVSPTGTTTFPANVALSVSGLPVGATYTITPASIGSGAGATSVTLTVTAPKQQAKMEHGNGFGRGLSPVALALLLLPFSGRLRRSAKKLSRFASLAVLLLAAAGALAGLTGCGVGEGIFAQPQQSYTVTVTGTSGALSHSTTVTLTVQ